MATCRFGEKCADTEVCDADSCPVPKPVAGASNGQTQQAYVNGAAQDEKSGKKTLAITITSDMICPWCYVGKRRLERALRAIDTSKVDIQVTWRPFQLDPHAPAPGVDKMARYREKFGPRMEKMLQHLGAIGDKEGINFKFGGKTGNTFNAHRLAEWAARFGKQDAVVEKLFNAYFEREQDISDLSVLEAVAVAAGLPRDQVAAFLRSQELAAEVQRNVEQAYALGITGVPHFVINNKYSFSGAQDADFFVCIFRKIGIL